MIKFFKMLDKIIEKKQKRAGKSVPEWVLKCRTCVDYNLCCEIGKPMKDCNTYRPAQEVSNEQ